MIGRKENVKPEEADGKKVAKYENQTVTLDDIIK